MSKERWQELKMAPTSSVSLQVEDDVEDEQ